MCGHMSTVTGGGWGSPVAAPGLRALPGWAPAPSASPTSPSRSHSPSPARCAASRSETHRRPGREAGGLSLAPPAWVWCPEELASSTLTRRPPHRGSTNRYHLQTGDPGAGRGRKERSGGRMRHRAWLEAPELLGPRAANEARRALPRRGESAAPPSQDGILPLSSPRLSVLLLVCLWLCVPGSSEDESQYCPH